MTIPVGKNPLDDDTTYYQIEWLSGSTYKSKYLSGGAKWLDSMINRRRFPETHKYKIIKIE